ncbi:hypothetical protein DITRI_Ditri16bG0084900 [Diplodiscus trichospermus]
MLPDTCGSSLFLALPDDVFAIILRFFSPKNICNLSVCCKSLCALVAMKRFGLVNVMWLESCLQGTLWSGVRMYWYGSDHDYTNLNASTEMLAAPTHLQLNDIRKSLNLLSSCSNSLNMDDVQTLRNNRKSIGEYFRFSIKQILQKSSFINETKWKQLLIATKILEGTHYVLHPNGYAIFIVKIDEPSLDSFPWDIDADSDPVNIKNALMREGIANGYGFRYSGSKPGSLFIIQNGLLAFIWKESRAILTLQ